MATIDSRTEMPSGGSRALGSTRPSSSLPARTSNGRYAGARRGRLLFFGATIAWCAWMLWAESLPTLDFAELILRTMALATLAATWLGTLLVAAVDNGRAAVARSSVVRWAVPPLLIIMTFAAVDAGLPMRVRLHVAEPELTAFAERVIADPDSPIPSSVASIPVEEVETFPGGMRFIAGDAFLDHAGFAYSPHRRPPRIDEDGYEHLAGPWYVWYRSWRRRIVSPPRGWHAHGRRPSRPQHTMCALSGNSQVSAL